MTATATLNVGDRVYVSGKSEPYTARACDERYAVCTNETRYFIADFAEGVRGTENALFCRGAETDEECRAMLERLNGRGDRLGVPSSVSRRNRVPLDIVRVVSAH